MKGIHGEFAAVYPTDTLPLVTLGLCAATPECPRLLTSCLMAITQAMCAATSAMCGP